MVGRHLSSKVTQMHSKLNWPLSVVVCSDVIIRVYLMGLSQSYFMSDPYFEAEVIFCIQSHCHPKSEMLLFLGCWDRKMTEKGKCIQLELSQLSDEFVLGACFPQTQCETHACSRPGILPSPKILVATSIFLFIPLPKLWAKLPTSKISTNFNFSLDKS